MYRNYASDTGLKISDLQAKYEIVCKMLQANCVYQQLYVYVIITQVNMLATPKQIRVEEIRGDCIQSIF